MKNKITLRNHLKVAAAHLNGQAKKQLRQSSRQPSWKKARCEKGVPSSHKKEPTSKETKMARKRRRKILDRRRLRRRLFVEK